MFQNNPLLAQLKQSISANKKIVEGVVRSHNKGFGFLVESDKTSHFITPNNMKKVMHGDKISALIEVVNGKEQAEPTALIQPNLTRFIAQVYLKKNKAGATTYHLSLEDENINFQIFANLASGITEEIKAELQDGDWVVAELKKHPLREQGFFSATIKEFICHADDVFARWWIILARYQHARSGVEITEMPEVQDGIEREDLTKLCFITIDSVNTKDIDDALYIEPIQNTEQEQIGWKLFIAIADPSAYIPKDSELDLNARQRGFTTYLPCFSIPMLPRMLSEELCSLLPNQKKLALVCTIELNMEGNTVSEPEFCCAWIKSRGKLNYQHVSDFLEQKENAWQPNQEIVRQQMLNLHEFAKARIDWRTNNAVLLKNNPEYSFIFDKNIKVQDIVLRKGRIANAIIEEAMVLANICAAQFLATKVKTGIYNVNPGFDKKFVKAAVEFTNRQLVTEQDIEYNSNNLSDLETFSKLWRHIYATEQNYVEMRLRRYLSAAEFKLDAEPHFGLGVSSYAMWTSPIRKYSDLINHRLIKQFLTQQPIDTVDPKIVVQIQEARRTGRLVERDIYEWLYLEYLTPMLADKPVFDAMIVDVNRGGIRVQLIDNGAHAFIPLSMIHPQRTEISLNLDDMLCEIKDGAKYQLTDMVKVQLTDIDKRRRNILATILD